MVAALERIGWAGEVIAGMVNDNDHVDNGNNSVLHPLTILHFSTGVADHYTIQSSWIQSLFLRKLGHCQDEALNNLARAMFHADTKQKVKAAMQVAFGRGVSLDNLNFYPADGAVATCDVTLETAFSTVARALRRVHTDKIGRVIVQKDLDWLAARGTAYVELANFQLKDGQRGTWDTLRGLADEVFNGQQ
jgi:hypothetical protein